MPIHTNDIFITFRNRNHFVKFAADHNIIVVCLPSHTTHALQPCDVGIFGPLASAWKSLVLQASEEYIAIRKDNLLHYYHQARERAFKKTTINSAFAKTGIHPWNPDALDPLVFELLLNTTTQAAQPMPAQLPSTLVEACDEPTLSAISCTVALSNTPVATPSLSAASALSFSAPTFAASAVSYNAPSETSDKPSSCYEVRGMPDPL